MTKRTTDYKQHILNNVEIDQITNCWNWKLCILKKCGYGQLSYHGKMIYAHRAAYEQFIGPIPEHDSYHGLCVCHTCDNRKCCNPAHLFLGTNKQNMEDRNKKSRQALPKGELHGEAKLSNENVYTIRKKYIPHVYTLKMLAEEFGVSISVVWHVVKGTRWNHI